MSSILSGAAKWLGPILLEAGADYLKNMLSGNGGGDLVGGVIEQIAGKIGVPAEQKAIERAYAERPQDVIQAVQEADTFWADIERSRAESMRSQHQLQIVETTKGGLLARIYRPLNGVLLALEVFAIVFVSCWLVMHVVQHGWPIDQMGRPLDLNSLLPLLGLVLPALGIQAGLVGYDMRQNYGSKG